MFEVILAEFESIATVVLKEFSTFYIRRINTNFVMIELHFSSKRRV